MNQDNLIEVRDLCVEFVTGEHHHRVVNHVSFDIKRGETLALVGESGSGKSVTAHSILRLLPYPLARHPAGTIEYVGQDLLTLNEKTIRHIRGNRIAMIFQEPMTSLNPLHCIEKQINEVLGLHKGLTGKVATRRTLELLELVGIPEPHKRLKALPHELSGGQRQRVMIAMALANEPELLIADEPTTALDVTVQLKILELLKELQARLGMALLLISHDLNLVRRIAHRVCVMQQGCIVEQADCETLFQSPQHPYTQELLAAEPSGGPAATAVGPPLLEVDDLKVWFPIKKGFLRNTVDYVKAVDGINFSLPQGQTLGIVGESGSGKSTLGLAILRLIASKGGIRFEGQQLDRLSQQQVRPLRREMQVVFQDRSQPQPAHVRQRDRRRRPAHSQDGQPGGAGSGDYRSAQGSRPRPAVAASLPPRVLRRPAPTHRHCPRPGAQAAPDPARRTDLGARPHGAAPSGGITARFAGQVQPDLSVHQP